MKSDGVIDLSSRAIRRREEREQNKNAKKLRKKTSERELALSSASTINIFINLIQKHVAIAYDKDFIFYCMQSCNQQLVALAMAFGWEIKSKEDVPVTFEMKLIPNEENKSIDTEILIGGTHFELVNQFLGMMLRGEVEKIYQELDQ